MPNKKHDIYRSRAIRRLRQVLLRFGAPRTHMMLIILVTGLAAFLFSVALSRLHVHSLAARYAMAISFAYLFFLGLVRLWLLFCDVRVRKAADIADDLAYNLDLPFDLVESMLPPALPDGGDGAGSVLDLFDLDDVFAIIAIVVATVGAIITAVYFVWLAPEFFAEVLLDGMLSAGLYRRLRKVPEGPHWALSVVRRTWKGFLIVLILLTVAGAAMQAAVPGAMTMGQALRHILSH